MSADVHIDRIDVLQMTETRGGPTNAGVVTSMTRVARVVNIISDDTGEALSDVRVLQQALTDVFQENASFAIGQAPVGFPDLICIERQVRLIPGQRDAVDVVCKYERRGLSLDSIGFIDDAPGGDDPQFIVRGSAGTRTITTQKQRDGVTDLNVAPYTYPANYWIESKRNKTDEYQVADMQVLFPSASLEFSFRFVTSTPGVIARNWAEHVNSAAWNAGAPRTWMCTRVDFEQQDFVPENKVWDFTIAFEHDETTWDNKVFFRDPSTGRKPNNLLPEGLNEYTVIWHPELNFSTGDGNGIAFPA